MARELKIAVLAQSSDYTISMNLNHVFALFQNGMAKLPLVQATVRMLNWLPIFEEIERKNRE